MPGNGPQRRERPIPFHTGKGLLRNSNNYGGIPKKTVTYSDGHAKPGKQVTVSEGHPFHSQVKVSRGDIGGDFFTDKWWIVPGNSSVYHYGKSKPSSLGYISESEYIGPFYPIAPADVVFPLPGYSSNNALDQAGATAIARCKPTNSIADASVFLGELVKEGLPSLIGAQTWKNRTHAGRKAGGEFLNVEFGWKPLVSDVRKFADAVRRADTVMKQYERDAGRMVRRRYEFPPQKSTSETTVKTNTAGFALIASSDFQKPTLGNVVRVRETTQRRWFSGAFTYHLPAGYDSRRTMSRLALEADKLYGLSLTPDTLWNLAPWSWAVDWFANVGDVLSNLSDAATDGLVMRYGYMMEHTTIVDTYKFVVTTKGDNAPPAPLIVRRETKVRRRANPFGFGVSWNGLSPRQLAITVALGLTRS